MKRNYDKSKFESQNISPLTSGLDFVVFWERSSLDFSRVTAPNAPYCPFITGAIMPDASQDDDEEEQEGGSESWEAAKQRSRASHWPDSTAPGMASGAAAALTTRQCFRGPT